MEKNDYDLKDGVLSIIVPIYNVEKYLAQCIESLINQTYRDIEIILVDDGSPDRCPGICDGYAKKDQRVKVIHQKNAGVSAARNTGLRMAAGAYIGFVDPDDWVRPDMYAGMIAALEQTQADMAICGYEYCQENGIIDGTRPYSCRSNETVSQKEVMRRFSDIPPTVRLVVWNKVFRRSLLEGIWFREGLHASEDVLFLTDYAEKIRSAVVVHQPYCCNRIRKGSATHGGLDVQSLWASFEAHEAMFSRITAIHPDLRPCSQAFLLDVCMLKYNEAKRKTAEAKRLTKQEENALRRMRRFIRHHGRSALLNRHIYWKTRIAYLFA